MTSASRDIFTVMDAVDKCMPADHPARAAGWDRELLRLRDMAYRFAPEIMHMVWAQLCLACRGYAGPHEAEDWPVKINRILSDTVCNVETN